MSTRSKHLLGKDLVDEDDTSQEIPQDLLQPYHRGGAYPLDGGPAHPTRAAIYWNHIPTTGEPMRAAKFGNRDPQFAPVPKSDPTPISKQLLRSLESVSLLAPLCVNLLNYPMFQPGFDCLSCIAQCRTCGEGFRGYGAECQCCEASKNRLCSFVQPYKMFDQIANEALKVVSLGSACKSLLFS